MHPLYDEFISALMKEDRENCVNLVLSSLEQKDIDIVRLYDDVLTPPFSAIAFINGESKRYIWEEHIRTSIIRTVIECCYPYVIRQRKQQFGITSKGKIVIFCPPGELHETGARMVTDFFTLSGFSVIFAGANTPQQDIINGIKYLKPKYVAISITNYFNLVAVRNTVQILAELKITLPFEIIIGGQACRGNPTACREMRPDMILNSFTEIKQLSERPDNVAL